MLVWPSLLVSLSSYQCLNWHNSFHNQSLTPVKLRDSQSAPSGVLQVRTECQWSCNVKEHFPAVRCSAATYGVLAQSLAMLIQKYSLWKLYTVRNIKSGSFTDFGFHLKQEAPKHILMAGRVWKSTGLPRKYHPSLLLLQILIPGLSWAAAMDLGSAQYWKFENTRELPSPVCKHNPNRILKPAQEQAILTILQLRNSWKQESSI